MAANLMMAADLIWFHTWCEHFHLHAAQRPFSSHRWHAVITMNRRFGGPGFQRPESALKRSEELYNVGQKHAALQCLHDIITSKKHRTWSKTYEQIMFKHVDLTVESKVGCDGGLPARRPRGAGLVYNATLFSGVNNLLCVLCDAQISTGGVHLTLPPLKLSPWECCAEAQLCQGGSLQLQEHVPGRKYRFS